VSAGWRLIEIAGEGSSSLGDFARLDASCANFHSARATLRGLNANRLKIRIESSGSAVIRVRDIVAELRSFTADFATFGHFLFNLQNSQVSLPAFSASYGT
jgi:hypothetical protein